MLYRIELTPAALRGLRRLRSFDRVRIAEEIRTGLANQPTIETRLRKRIEREDVPFEHVPPLWQLRVGRFRVFYDVDEAEQLVTVYRVVEKPPNKTTQEVLRESD